MSAEPLPLIGRARELAGALRALSAGTPGALLAGPAGVGRSRLLAEAREQASANGFSVVDLDVDHDPPPGSLLVADDLQLLSVPHAARLRAAVVEGGVRLLGAVASHPAPPEAINRLWRDDGVVRIDLQPLDRSDVAALAAHAAGGPVDGITADRLLGWSGGIPSALVALLGPATPFERHRGVFSLGSAMPLSRTLRAQAADLLAPAPRDAGWVAELVVVGEAVAEDTLQAIVPDEAIEAAIEAGLVAAAGHPLRLTPVSRFVGALLLAAMPGALVDARLEELSLAIECRRQRSAPLDEELLVLARWYARTGELDEEHLDVVLQAAALALERRDTGLAELLSRAAWVQTGSSEAGLDLALALVRQGRAGELLTVATTVADEAQCERHRAAALDRSAGALAALGRRDEAMALLQAVVDDFEEPLGRGLVEIALASHELHAGVIGAAAERARPFANFAPEAALVSSVASTLQGRSDHALALLDEVGMAADGTEHEPGTMVLPLLDVARAVALTEAGRLRDAEAVARPAYDAAVAAGDGPLLGWTAICMGRLALAHGHARSALAWFRDALFGFSELGEAGYLAWAYAGCAGSHALLGEVEPAIAALAEHDGLPPHGTHLYEPESARLLAQVDLVADNPAAAIERLRAGAALAAETGQLVVEAACWRDLACFGPTSGLDTVAARLADLAQACDGELVSARSEHAVALAVGDPAGLASCAARWSGLAMHLDAAQAWAEAAARATGRASAASNRRAWAALGRCEGAGTPTTASLPVITVSPREREVAELVVAGIERAEVAARLSISSRTVDRHLGSAFAKLGVTDRGELADALADLGPGHGVGQRSQRESGGLLAEWPLIGRDGERRELRAASTRSTCRGAVLVGPPGVGKTRLATEVHAELVSHGWVGLRLLGLSPGSALADLAAMESGERVAVLIDDAHHLDAATAAMVAPVIARRHVFTIATERPSDHVASWLPEAIRSDFVTVEVTAFGVDEVGGLLRAGLQALVLDSTVDALAAASGGNPLLLRELVRAGLADGSMRARGGLWELTGAPTVDARLGDLVRSHLAPLDGVARQAAELLAVAGGIPTSTADSVLGPGVVARLVEVGLVDDDGLEVRLAHPSFAETLRADQLPATRQRLLGDLVDRLGQDHEVDPVRLGLWLLDADRDPPPAVLLAGAQRAAAFGDVTVARRLATAARRAGAGDAAGRVLAETLIISGELEEAEPLLAELASRGQPRDRVRAAVARSDLALWDRGDGPRALAALEAVDDLVRANALEADEQRQLHEQRDLVVAVVDRRLVPGTTRGARRLFIEAGVAFTVGALVEAASLARAGFDALQDDEPRAPALADALHAIEVEAHLQGGWVERAVEVVARWRPVVSPGRAGLARPASEGGRVALYRGDIAGARLWFQDGLGDPVAQPGTQTWLWLRSGLALAAALGGDVKTARAELAATAYVGHRNVLLEVVRVRAVAWADATDGGNEVAAASLAAAARNARRSGLATPEAMLLHDQLRLAPGGPGVVEAGTRLLEVTAGMPGPLAEARRAHAEAVLCADPRALLDAASLLGVAGVNLTAAEAALAAAALHARRGERRAATAAERAGRDWLATCPGAHTPGTIGTASGLTPRQAQVADLAARGLSNQDIASRLGVSVRTVENQLQRIYERLGLSGRTELPQALSATFR